MTTLAKLMNFGGGGKQNLLKATLITAVSLTTALMANSALAASLMDVGTQEATFTGLTRGFWFTAPKDFKITGLGLPTDASTDNFDVAVMRFNEAIPQFSASTTNFDTLFLSRDNAGSNLLDVDINVSSGDIIGIFGSRGSDSTNSYGSSNYLSNILGTDVTLQRLLMQEDLRFVDPVNIGVSKEADSRIGRVLVEIEEVTPIPESSSLFGLLGVGSFGFLTSLKRKSSSSDS